MTRNQKGFGAIEGLLIVVAVGLIGFVGWYVWSSKNKTAKNLAETNSVNQTTDNTAQDRTSDSQEPVDAVDTVDEKGEELAIMGGSATLHLYDWTLDSHSTKAFGTSNDDGDVRLNCSEKATIVLPKSASEPSNAQTFIFVCDNQDGLSPADYYKKYQSIYGRGKPDVDEQKTLKVDGRDAFERFTKREATTGVDASYAAIALDYTIKADDKMLWIYTTFATNEDFVPKLNKVIQSVDFKD